MSEARGVIRAYLGLGANLGDRRETLEHAISLLSQRPGIRLLRISSLYETEPVDVAGGWFFNGVVEAETSLAPQQLLETLLQVEEACGRPQTRGRGEERVVDIDLCAIRSELTDNIDNLRVAHIGTIFLECEAEHQNSRITRLNVLVQHELDHTIRDIQRHIVIDLAARQNHLRVIPQSLRFERQVVGIDADTMAANKTGSER